MSTNPFALSVRQAFSLVELLVAIAIIAILVALTIPAVGYVKERANQSKCSSNLKHLGTAIHLYAADNDNRIPMYATGSIPDLPVSGAWWHQRIDTYFDSKFTENTQSKVFLCPADKNPYAGTISYGMNYNLVGKRVSDLQGRLILLTEDSSIIVRGNASDIATLKYNHARGKLINTLYVDGSVQPLSKTPGLPNSTVDPLPWIP